MVTMLVDYTCICQIFIPPTPDSRKVGVRQVLRDKENVTLLCLGDYYGKAIPCICSGVFIWNEGQDSQQAFSWVDTKSQVIFISLSQETRHPFL